MFENLGKMRVDENSTAEWSSPYLNSGESILIVSPAGQHNDKYFAQLLAKTRVGRSNLQKLMFTPDFIKKNRDNDRRLYPKFVLKGWKNVVDDDGNPVEFSEETATQFVRALPAWLFEDLREFCTKAENFIEEPIDVEDTAGN